MNSHCLSGQVRPCAPQLRKPQSAIAFRAASHAQTHHAARKDTPELLDPCAAALDQYNQNDDNQHAGNNPNDCGTIHVDSSFP